MSKRHRHPSRSVSPTRTKDLLQGERLRRVWLGGVAALYVAAPLIPSDSAPSGRGVSLLMAWFVLCAAFVVTGAIQRNLRIRIGPADIAMLVFVVLHTLSALVLAETGQPRQTLNMLWQWVGFGVAFFLVRQLVRTPQESRALIVIMIALAVCLSMHGYYQYFHSLPEARRAYAADPEGTLARLGSVDRAQFENRLFYSTEPMATFTLANSLAGFLAPWLLCAAGIGALNWPNRQLRRSLVVPVTVSVLLVIGCFVLTKSRSATLGLFFGALLLLVYGRRRGWRPGWKLTASVFCSLAALLALAVSVGGLDWQVLTESSKSFLYRIQYWRASLAMIGDAPWFGCGPGNFQQAYAAYKLPEASETIADPHNFLLEIWCTAGTPAMLAFLALFVCVAYQLRRGFAELGAQPMQPAAEAEGCVRAVYWGALAGVPFAFVAGLAVDYLPDFALLIVGLPVAAGIVFSWHPWVMQGRLPIVVLLASTMVVLLNLSAAGGISFMGVALTLWLLFATALNCVDRGGASSVPGRVAAAVGTTAATVAFLFWYSTFVPVLSVSAYLARADTLRMQGRLAEAEQTLLTAVAADSYSAEPWQALAQLRLEMWIEGGDTSREADFVEATHQALGRHQRYYALHQASGDWYLRAYRARNERRLLGEAIAGYRRAVERYPNYNFGHAQLAWALRLAGEVEQSRVEAGEALRLDELNPHQEKKLAQRVVFDPPRRAHSQPPNPPDVDAEQLMWLLRTSPEGSFGSTK